jgi:hypothetical protein
VPAHVRLPRIAILDALSAVAVLAVLEAMSATLFFTDRPIF